MDNDSKRSWVILLNHFANSCCDDLKKKPTERQAECLYCILCYQRVFGFQPSIRDLCVSLEVNSTNAVHDNLKALQKKGWIRLVGKGKGIFLTSRSWNIFKLLSDSDIEFLFKAYFWDYINKKDLQYASFSFFKKAIIEDI